MPEAVLFDEQKIDRLATSTARLDDAELVELMMNVLAHAHVLAEEDQHAGLHNTIYCGDSALNEIARRWIPVDVWNAAAEQFERPADDA